MATIRLQLIGRVADIVHFEHHRARYIFATDDGLAARAHVARSLTPAILDALRRPPPLAPDWSKMRLLFDAGILVCPGSGLPVFNPSAAPPALWTFFTALATALNTPSATASEAAAAAAQELGEQLREGGECRRVVGHSTPAKASETASERARLAKELSEHDGTDTEEQSERRQRRRLSDSRTGPPPAYELERDRTVVGNEGKLVELAEASLIQKALRCSDAAGIHWFQLELAKAEAQHLVAVRRLALGEGAAEA